MDACPLSRYEISRQTGIAQSQLSRLYHGEAGLGFDALDRLAECIDVEIVVRPRRRTRKKGR